MRITTTIRVVGVAYWLLLTVVLLAPDPRALLGITRAPGPPGGRVEHLVLFGVLALLACASRLPLRRGPMVGLLVGYALLTETAQALVPTRTVELLDYVENLLGLGAGCVLWRLIHWRFPEPNAPSGGSAAATGPPASDSAGDGASSPHD